MKLTSPLVEAFLKCPMKCYLRSTGEAGSGNAYAEWVREQNEVYRSDAVARVIEALPEGERAITAPAAANLKTATWRLVLDLPLETGTMASWLHAVERVPPQGRGRPAEFIPVRFVFFNKLTKDDRLLVAFDALVLSEVLGRRISLSKITHGDDHATLKVKIPGLLSATRRLISEATALLAGGSPPDLILNRHCGECEFHDGCRQKALEKDDLSLLGGMTEKERKKCHSKGIFTVTQLSHTFRPRRRPKRLCEKPEKYHHALKALAIREKKIHVVGSPELNIEGTPVYLDVEGLPDRDFYYLIGVRIGNGEAAVQHSLWADNVEDEQKVWQKFLVILETVEKPVLIHYGSYETTFLKRMCERYSEPSEGSGAAKVTSSAVNLVSLIFAHIYFPTFSNSLKEVAGWLGFRWSEMNWTGLQTIAWRERWATLRGGTERMQLTRYNAEDCAALELVAKTIFGLYQRKPMSEPESEAAVVDITSLKREHPYGFKRNIFAIPELDAINKAAYWDYQRERVYLRSSHGIRQAIRRACQRRRRLRPNRVIQCPRPPRCPFCGATAVNKREKANKIVLDLKFIRGGVKRWIVRYEFNRYICLDCRKTFLPQDREWTGSKYGPSLLAYSIYKNIELRLPAGKVDQSLNKVFGLQLPANTTEEFKEKAAEIYARTYYTLLEKLKNGSLIHADETRISLRSGIGFVWVFANMEEVAYLYAATREADMVQTFLKDFKGVLVSDFFAAYDGIGCPQQKCLIHLIRDVNDALHRNPYDNDFKKLAQGFAGLVKPMVETVDRFGLKSRFLKKHLSSVDRFYRELSRMVISSEAAIKFKDRLDKNRDKLFTFLSFDGVPWNNNNAEHAIKAFAMLRHVIGGVTTEKGIRDYLVLLSLCETCKYKGLDFLDFLRSGEKDIDAFAGSRCGRRRRSRSKDTGVLATQPG